MEVDVRLPREMGGIHDERFCRILFFWLLVCTRYEIPAKSTAIAIKIRELVDVSKNILSGEDIVYRELYVVVDD